MVKEGIGFPLVSEQELEEVAMSPSALQAFAASPAAEGMQAGFEAEWKVVDGLNREVYRFGGIGNSQSDANRVAREWAQRTGFDGNLEVYPVMR